MTERLSRLRDYGLSEYGARAYLALLDLGIAEARDVSGLSKVPQAKIYHVLEQLHEKGLVVVLPEFPKKYAPVPFGDYLHRLHEEHNRAASAIQNEREELAELFRVVGNADVSDRGFFTVLRGRRNVLAKLSEILASTQRELLLLATPGTLSRADTLLPELAAARARGVETRMLAPVESATLPALQRFVDVATIRARESTAHASAGTVAILVSDAQRAFLIHFVPDDDSTLTGKDVGVLTDQEAMVAAILAMLGPSWDRASSLATRRDEIEAGRPPTFTRVHASIVDAWKAILAAADGAKEVCYLRGGAAPGVHDEGGKMADKLVAKGGSFRIVMNFANVASLDAFESFTARYPPSEARHLSASVVSRYWLVDGREGFFSLAPAANGAESVVHTNDPSVLQTMQEGFESAWRVAVPLSLRRKELEIFPDLQPGDLGIGMLFNVLGDAVVVTDSAGRVVLWNPAATEVFGYAVTEALGMDATHLIPAAQRATSVAWLTKRRGKATRLDPDRAVSGKALRKDGREIDVEVMARQLSSAAHAGPYLLSVVRDVTARKGAAEAERRSRERILRIYESMQEAFIALDRNWRIIYMNPVAEKMRLSPKETVLGRVLWDVYEDLRGSKFDTEYHRAMRDNVSVAVEEYYPRMSRWFEAKAFPSEEGLSVYFSDITARKQSEARFARAFQDAPVGIALIGEGGRFVEVNSAFANFVGRTQGEILTMDFRDLTFPADRPASEAAVREIIAGQSSTVSMEKRYLRKDGTAVSARLTLSIVRRDPIEFIAQVQPLQVIRVEPREAERSRVESQETSR